MRLVSLFMASVFVFGNLAVVTADVKEDALSAMKAAATYYYRDVATHGGYVYFYSLDLQQRWGEGVATKDQIWVQPPGTPTVGLAYLKAYESTGDEFYLEAATAAAESLVYGQLKSGGWTNCVDFNPRGERRALYRNGRGRGKDNSSLDDGQTQSALRLLVQCDKAHKFKHAAIHEAAATGLKALLAAQFECGAFPQVWTGQVAEKPVVKAKYPDYDWRTEGRIKEYWDLYTLNDNTCGYITDTLIDAYRIYEDDRYLKSLRRLGDFLLLAQMPEPQPAWAQQYNYEMQPVWARRFEPPGVSGDESQEAIETLMKIAKVTDDRKFLTPIPSALAYLRRSLLPEGKLARYYELKTNKPLYMTRRGKNYTLTHDDSNLPSHYGWKTDSRLDELEQRYKGAMRGESVKASKPNAQQVRDLIQQLDSKGRWIDVSDGRRLVGQAKIAVGSKYLSSETFSNNLRALAEFVSRD